MLERKKIEQRLGNGHTLRQVIHRQPRDRQLQQNPFTTYRDPQTGRWVVVRPATL